MPSSPCSTKISLPQLRRVVFRYLVFLRIKVPPNLTLQLSENLLQHCLFFYHSLQRQIPYALLPGNKCGRLQGSQAPMFFNARLYMAPGGWVLLFFGALRPSLSSGSFAPRSWHILLRREGQRSSGSLV